MRIPGVLPKKYDYSIMTDEGNIICLSFNHVFHPNFSRYINTLLFTCHLGTYSDPCDLPEEHEYAAQQNILIKREFQVINLQRSFISSTLMLKFIYIIRNLSFDDSQSSANRAIIPKNIITNNSMNFTSSTSLIWTRYIHIHIFRLFF